MRLDWGQGKIEVLNHRQEILDFLADGWTVARIFRHFQSHGLLAGKATFHRTVKVIKAELSQSNPPALASKAQPPKISDQRSPSTTISSERSQPSSQAAGSRSRSSLVVKGFNLALDEDDENHWR
jgi:hypothetical protein